MDNRLKVKFVLFFAICAAMASPLCSQNVIVNSKLDSVEMFIGSQSRLTVETTVDSGTKVVFPELKDFVVPGLEIIETLMPDTSFLNEGQRMSILQTYFVASFDSAFYHIPGFKVYVGGNEYESNDLVLRVYRFPIDNDDVNAIKDAADIVAPEFVFADWVAMIAFAIIAIALLAAAVFLFIRYKDNKPIIRIVRVEPPLLPHEKAEKIIEEIKAGNMPHSSNPKDYYTSLTEALRVYIAGRFNFNAMEMTSSEIISKLLESNDKESLRELQSLFSVADLVKFAKHVPLLNENDANLLTAVAFINKTKIEPTEAEREKPRDVVIEEPRSKRMKMLLLGIIAIATVAFIAFLVLLVLEVKLMLI